MLVDRDGHWLEAGRDQLAAPGPLDGSSIAIVVPPLREHAGEQDEPCAMPEVTITWRSVHARPRTRRRCCASARAARARRAGRRSRAAGPAPRQPRRTDRSQRSRGTARRPALRDGSRSAAVAPRRARTSPRGRPRPPPSLPWALPGASPGSPRRPAGLGLDHEAASDAEVARERARGGQPCPRGQPAAAHGRAQLVLELLSQAAALRSSATRSSSPAGRELTGSLDDVKVVLHIGPVADYAGAMPHRPPPALRGTALMLVASGPNLAKDCSSTCSTRRSRCSSWPAPQFVDPQAAGMDAGARARRHARGHRSARTSPTRSRQAAPRNGCAQRPARDVAATRPAASLALALAALAGGRRPALSVAAAVRCWRRWPSCSSARWSPLRRGRDLPAGEGQFLRYLLAAGCCWRLRAGGCRA